MAIIYTTSLYTSAIMELEQAADLIEHYATETEQHFIEPGQIMEFASVVSGALRHRAEKLREQEASELPAIPCG